MKYILVLLMVTSQMFATGQIADRVIINSDTLLLFSEPLHSYFEKNNINTDSLFEKFEWSTACHDRHYALWEIENDFPISKRNI